MVTSRSTRMFFLLIVFVVLISILYWNVFVDLVGIWGSKEEYSHGYMIPFISLYFLWQQKGLISSEKLYSSWIGLVVSVIAIAIYFVGVVGDVYFLLRFSLILLLLGIALSICGVKVTRLMLVPILILIFSFPLPPVVQAGLTAKLQLISSQLGVSFIRACEIPVFLEGNVIDLGNYKLQVVEACSGLRYLFPLMSLAFICVYMYHVVLWKRVLVFLTSIPVTVLMNSFRIGVIGILVDNWGISMAEGFIHDFEGWIVFMACFIVLFLEMWLLSWNERKTLGWGNVFGMVVPKAPVNVNRIQLKAISASTLGILILLIFAITSIKQLGEKEDLILGRKEFYDFPTQLDDWSIVSSDKLDNDTVKFLGLSDYLLMTYSKDNHHLVNFYVAYYKSQKHGVVPHSPKLCIPGGGWLILDIKEVEFSDIEFNRAIISKDKVNQLVYYWYRQRGKNIANEYFLKWNTFVGSFKHQRTDGALIRLTTLIENNETVQDADIRLQQFTKVMDEELFKYIPN